MENKLHKDLTSQIEQGGQAYIRNLVAAEQAVLQGKFNIAKVLRASAHSQRILAMQAARLLENNLSDQDLLKVIRDEVSTDKSSDIGENRASQVSIHLENSNKIREGLQDIIKRSLSSLENNPDILESDVPLSLWGCYGCGAILEGDPPHACPICGALSIEFEWFGPFYSGTAEHLGQLKPEDIIEIIERIPDEVEAIITQVDTAILQQKPSPDEWSAAEIIGHMLETDMLFVKRATALIEAHGGELPRPMPPWKLHEGKGYESMQAEELMTHMRRARTQSLNLIRGMKSEDWLRKGHLLGSKMTMLDLGTWLANHDRGHLAQVQRLCGL